MGRKNNILNILTTSPSISLDDNVSGIANLTRLLVENNKEVQYILFEAGKKDKTSYGIFWFLKQPLLLLNFIRTLFFNKINVVHINMPLEKLALIRDLCFLLISTLFFKPTVIHIRGGMYNLKVDVPFFIRILIGISLKLPSKIILLGEKERDFFINNYKVKEEKLVVLPNCVKVPDSNIEREFSQNSKIKLLYLGRLDKNKGLKEIIVSLKTAKENLDFCLNIAGDGPDKDWFLKQCNDNFGNLFKYYGVVSGYEKKRLLENSNVFLLPSYFEGLPNALLEGMSYGLIPVVTAVGSIPNVVTDNFNGIIIPVNDAYSLKKAIININSDPIKYQHISNQAYLTIKNNYSLEKYLDSINSVYRSLVS